MILLQRLETKRWLIQLIIRSVFVVSIVFWSANLTGARIASRYCSSTKAFAELLASTLPPSDTFMFHIHKH